MSESTASPPPVAPEQVPTTPPVARSSTPRRDPTPQRKVLMITFHYPPSNTSSGGLRPLKFGKYLQQLGWQSSVLTVPVSCHESTDAALLLQIPRGVTVYRARCFDAKKTFGIRGRYPGFLAVPDRYTSWLPFGAASAIHAVRRDRIDALFSTSPIPTAHLIALVTKLTTKTPWVADFRDPWVETEGGEVYAPFRQSVELWLERQVVRHADRILVTTREFANVLSERYGEFVKNKIHAVYNGYDEDDFDGLVPETTPAERFGIIHAGLLDPNYRNPEPFLRAVRLCLDGGTLPADTYVRFIGGGAYAAGNALAQALAELRLHDVVKLEQRMPYGQVLAALAAAPSLLLLQGGIDTRTLIPAKAFEYLHSGRLVLTAAPPDSATARLMHEFKGTFVTDPSDSIDIAQGLAAMFETWTHGVRSLDRDAEGLARYSRRAAATQLAEILQHMARPLREAPGVAA